MQSFLSGACTCAVWYLNLNVDAQCCFGCISVAVTSVLAVAATVWETLTVVEQLLDIR